MDLNKFKYTFVSNLNTFYTWSLNLKAKKFKSNINHQGLNIATYGQAYSTETLYCLNRNLLVAVYVITLKMN